MSSPPNTPLSVANVALTEARVMRGEWLQLLASGSVTVTDLLVAAADGEGSPLRRLRLEQVLAAQEEWSIERARTVVDMTVRDSGNRSKPKGPPTVGWLLDPRSDGRRVSAFAAAMASLEFNRLDRFPFRPLAVAK